MNYYFCLIIVFTFAYKFHALNVATIMGHGYNLLYNMAYK